MFSDNISFKNVPFEAVSKWPITTPNVKNSFPRIWKYGTERSTGEKKASNCTISFMNNRFIDLRAEYKLCRQLGQH